LLSTPLRGGSRGSGFASPRTGSGWRVSRSAHAGFVLDALEQTLHEHRPFRGGLVHHAVTACCNLRYSLPYFTDGVEGDLRFRQEDWPMIREIVAELSRLKRAHPARVRESLASIHSIPDWQFRAGS
jgi:hypothetical protein